MDLKRFRPHIHISWINPIYYMWFTLIEIEFNKVLYKRKYDIIRIEILPRLKIKICNIEINITFGTYSNWEEYVTNKHNNG